MSQNLPFPFHPNGGVPLPPTHSSAANAQQTSAQPPTPSVPQAQQSAFQTNAQLPAPDLTTLLQGVTPEQFAGIMQLFQSGQFQLPPQFATVATPSASGPTQSAVNGAGAMTPQAPRTMTDVDKEEGEWEEDEAEPPRQSDSTRQPPKAPKKRSASPRDRRARNGVDKRSRHRQSPPPRQSDGRTGSSRDGLGGKYSAGTAPSASASALPIRQANRASAKAFVTSAYRAGFTIDDFAREVGDTALLRQLFTELGLPTDSQQAPSSKVQPVAGNGISSGKQAVAAPQNISVRPIQLSPAGNVAAAGTKSSSASQKPAPATPAVPPNRADYLAKLQAARNKKSENTNSPTAPIATSSASVAAAALPERTQPDITTALAQPPVEDAPPPPKKAKLQTDLVRQRLAALREERARKLQQEAEEAASKTATPAPISAPSDAWQVNNAKTMPTGTLNEVSGEAAQASPAPAPRPPLSASPGVQFPGLPGLFMTMAGGQAQPSAVNAPIPSATASAQPITHPESRAAHPNPSSTVISSLDTSTANSPAQTAANLPSVIPPVQTAQNVHSGRTTPRHTFGQSRYDSNDDSVVIDISEEEESELDDEADDLESAKANVHASKPGPLPHFPPVASLNAVANGSLGSGASTPGGIAYDQKVKELTALKERLRLAEEKKAKASVPVLTRSAGIQSPAPTAATSSIPPTSAAPLATALPGLAAATASSVTENTAVQQQRTHDIEVMKREVEQLQEEAGITQYHSSDASAQASAIAPTSKNGNAAKAADSGQLLSESSADDAMDVSSDDDEDSDSENGQLDAEDVANATPDQDMADSTTVTPSQSQSLSGAQQPISGVSTQQTQKIDEPHATRHEPAGQASDVDSDSDSMDEDSSTSSDSDEDDVYEPELSGTMQESPGATLPGSLLATDPGIAANVAMAEPRLEPQDADLAPELQPTQAELADSSHQVSILDPTDAEADPTGRSIFPRRSISRPTRVP